MPRTVDVEAHRDRRVAFLDGAQRLILAKGYEEMSIQDVLDEVDTSRGAFYHYFDSKAALMEAVVDRFAEQGLAEVAPIVHDPELSALQKLASVFAGIARFKSESKDLVMRLMEIWESDGNAVVREKVRRLTVQWLTPMIATIVRQGQAEGSFRVESPDLTATVLAALLEGLQPLAIEYFRACQAGTMTTADVRRRLAGFDDAYERILGGPPGSLTLVDEPTLRLWFGGPREGGD